MDVTWPHVSYSQRGCATAHLFSVGLSRVCSWGKLEVLRTALQYALQMWVLTAAGPTAYPMCSFLVLLFWWALPTWLFFTLLTLYLVDCIIGKADVFGGRESQWLKTSSHQGATALHHPQSILSWMEIGDDDKVWTKGRGNRGEMELGGSFWSAHPILFPIHHTRIEWGHGQGWKVWCSDPRVELYPGIIWQAIPDWFGMTGVLCKFFWSVYWCNCFSGNFSNSNYLMGFVSFWSGGILILKPKGNGIFGAHFPFPAIPSWQRRAKSLQWACLERRSHPLPP